MLKFVLHNMASTLPIDSYAFGIRKNSIKLKGGHKCLIISYIADFYLQFTK